MLSLTATALYRTWPDLRESILISVPELNPVLCEWHYGVLKLANRRFFLRQLVRTAQNVTKIGLNFCESTQIRIANRRDI